MPRNFHWVGQKSMYIDDTTFYSKFDHASI